METIHLSRYSDVSADDVLKRIVLACEHEERQNERYRAEASLAAERLARSDEMLLRLRAILAGETGVSPPRAASNGRLNGHAQAPAKRRATVRDIRRDALLRVLRESEQALGPTDLAKLVSATPGAGKTTRGHVVDIMRRGSAADLFTNPERGAWTLTEKGQQVAATLADAGGSDG